MPFLITMTLKIDFSPLKITLGGGMAVQQDTASRWKQLTQKPLIEAYGLTETSPAVCINPLDIPDYNGSIGVHYLDFSFY